MRSPWNTAKSSLLLAAAREEPAQQTKTQYSPKSIYNINFFKDQESGQPKGREWSRARATGG